jgi:uncharacterized metal-binding protein
MASGKTHDQSIVVTAFIIPFIMLHYRLGTVLEILIFTITYLFSGFYLSPDIDTKSVVFQRYGLLKFFWKPYQRLFPHRGSFFHRNFYTHFPIIATVIRLSYFLAVPLIILNMNGFDNWETLYKPVLTLYFATEISSFVHLIFDIIYTKRH